MLVGHGTAGRDSAQTLLKYPGNRPLWVGRVIPGKSLEMTGCSVATLGADCMITVDSYHGLEMYARLCSSTRYLNCSDSTPMVVLESGLERKKMICVTHDGLER